MISWCLGVRIVGSPHLIILSVIGRSLVSLVSPPRRTSRSPVTCRPHGNATVDRCDTCMGTNACLDCAGFHSGPFELDACGVCRDYTLTALTSTISRAHHRYCHHRRDGLSPPTSHGCTIRRWTITSNTTKSTLPNGFDLVGGASVWVFGRCDKGILGWHRDATQPGSDG